MRTVAEIVGKDGSSYLVDDGFTKSAVRTSCHRVDVNGRTVWVFYDSDMNLLEAPSLFFYDALQYDSENTRLQAASALKLLYSFSALTGMPPESFDQPACKAFLQFARGTLEGGVSTSFDLATRRAESTIGSYLKTVRRLMEYLEAYDSPFLKRNGARRSWLDLEDREARPYAVGTTGAPKLEAPLAITPKEYRRILECAGSHPDDPARPMIRLMFEHGLRIGEVLGLTTEDIVAGASPDGDPRYSLRLRDRASDAVDQHAKTVVKVTSAVQYDSPDYRKRNVGFQEVFISESLFDDLSRYVEEVHGAIDGKTCRADSVTGASDNRYVFLNSRGRRLTSNLWNKRLRALFQRAGVQTDEESRKTNLNHRFRHGFAMMLVHELKLDDFAVMTLMRHRSIRSTEAYNRPTAEQVHEMQVSVLAGMEAALFGGGDA